MRLSLYPELCFTFRLFRENKWISPEFTSRASEYFSFNLTACFMRYIQGCHQLGLKNKDKQKTTNSTHIYLFKMLITLTSLSSIAYTSLQKKNVASIARFLIPLNKKYI